MIVHILDILLGHVIGLVIAFDQFQIVRLQDLCDKEGNFRHGEFLSDAGMRTSTKSDKDARLWFVAESLWIKIVWIVGPNSGVGPREIGRDGHHGSLGKCNLWIGRECKVLFQITKDVGRCIEACQFIDKVLENLGDDKAFTRLGRCLFGFVQRLEHSRSAPMSVT